MSSHTVEILKESYMTELIELIETYSLISHLALDVINVFLACTYTSDTSAGERYF